MEEIKLHGELSSRGCVEGTLGKGVTRVVTVVNEHDKLINRDLPNQHPIDAIEGLANELMSIKNTQSNTSLSIKNKIRTVTSVPSDMQIGEYIFLEKGEIVNG